MHYAIDNCQVVCASGEVSKIFIGTLKVLGKQCLAIIYEKEIRRILWWKQDVRYKATNFWNTFCNMNHWKSLQNKFSSRYLNNKVIKSLKDSFNDVNSKISSLSNKCKITYW